MPYWTEILCFVTFAYAFSRRRNLIGLSDVDVYNYQKEKP